MKVYFFLKKAVRWIAACWLRVGASCSSLATVTLLNSTVLNRILSWIAKGQNLLFPMSFVMYATTFLHLVTILGAFDDILNLPFLDWVRDFIYGKSNTIDIKSDVPVLPPRESVVITPELEKAIAICNKEGYSVVHNKEGYSVVQASPDPSTSIINNLAHFLSLVIIVGFFMLKS
jgi:hypothetical protein